jgi:hypothetical protein
MKNIFIIAGYGIPKDILKDEHYNFYLKTVFNRIYDIAGKAKDRQAIIICCGGKTDMFKPYRRTEAGEMIKLFKKLCNRSFLKNVTKGWQLIPENKSISTLENLLYSKKKIKKKRLEQANAYIFCEYTRASRIRLLVKNIFGKQGAKVLPIDFDISLNRYLEPDFIQKKERIELDLARWALKNKSNLTKYNQLYRERIKFLRTAGPGDHSQAVKNWWDMKLKELKIK